MMGIASSVTMVVGGLFLGAGLFLRCMPDSVKLQRSLRLFVALCPIICAYFVCRAIGFETTDPVVAGRLIAWQHSMAGIFYAVFPFILSGLIGLRVGPLVLVLSAMGVLMSLWSPFTAAGMALDHVDTLEAWLTPWGERISLPKGPVANTVIPTLGLGIAEALLGLFWISRGLARTPLAVRMGVAACLAMLAFSMLYHGAILLKLVHGPVVGEWSVAFLLLAVGGLLAHRSRQHAGEHRELLNAVSEAVLVHDPVSGVILDANDRALTSFASTREQLIGLQLPDVMDAAQRFDAPRMAEYFASAQAGTAHALLIRCLKRDGQVFEAEVQPSAAIIGGKDCVITSVRDVSRRLNAEREVQAQALRLDDFIERAPIAVCEVLSDGRIKRINQHFRRLFGLAETELPTWEELLQRWHSDAAQRNQLRETFQAHLAAAAAGDGVLRPLAMRVAGAQGTMALSCSGVISQDSHLLFVVDLTALEQTRNELLQQAALSDAVIANAADGVAVCEWSEGERLVFTVWNPRLGEITGYSQDHINREGWFETVYANAEDQAQARSQIERMAAETGLGMVEWVIRRADQSECILSVSASVLPSPSVGSHVLVLVMRDVTERRRAERERRHLEVQVQHAQKLESLGVLAGGIAHDFNNILMSVLGRASLMSNQLPSTHESHPHLREIENAANRAAELCRQMLAYAGKGRFIVEPLDLETAVTEMGRMLEVSIAKKIVLKYDFADGLPAVNADASQIRQVIMNLITNASEAIGDRSGVITLRTGVMECDREYLRETYLDDDLPEGLYAYIEIADTGCGMDVETRQRLFEPFYTTKFTGRGLGMAAVLGIIRGHRGAIKVYSEPRRGSTMKVLFPAIRQRALPAAGAVSGSLRLPPGLRILVVDDEETIRALAKDMLIGLGADVLLAADGREALAVFSRFGNEIDIVLLDLTMPHMDGDETFRELRRVNRDVRVIMSSGYNQQEVTQRFAGKGLVGFLQKPYNLQALVSAIRQALPNEANGSGVSGNTNSPY